LKITLPTACMVTKWSGVWFVADCAHCDGTTQLDKSGLPSAMSRTHRKRIVAA
jgi:hypothetical protein